MVFASIGQPFSFPVGLVCASFVSRGESARLSLLQFGFNGLFGSGFASVGSGARLFSVSWSSFAFVFLLVLV